MVYSGITMDALGLLIADRIRLRRAWGPAAVCLFTAGFTAWLFLPMVAAAWVVGSWVLEPFSFFRHIFFAHNMGAYDYEAFYHFWPIACLALFVGCNLSG
jgi:hypothetical protein